MDDDEFVGDSEEESEMDHPLSPNMALQTGLSTSQRESGENGDSEIALVEPMFDVVRDGQELEFQHKASQPTPATQVHSNADETMESGIHDTHQRDLEESKVDEQLVADFQPRDDTDVEMATVDNKHEEEERERAATPTFRVGDIVHVVARTWPGINKQGGAGKIAAVLREIGPDGSDEFMYNVKYMLGGFEKRIEEEFIQDLDSTLETGARAHKERVYYHDEYASKPQKKMKQVQAELGLSGLPNELVEQPTPAPVMSKAKAKPPRKKSQASESNLIDAPDIPFEVHSSDDSDYELHENDDDDDQVDLGTPRRKLEEDSFILDERIARPRDRTDEGSTGKKSHRKRRADGVTPSRGGEHDRGQRRTDLKAKRRRKRVNRILESDSEEHSESDHHPKKKRYVGGYHHDAEDGEGNFIQPEGNTSELPEDVAQELRFKLGKTKAELRGQLRSVNNRLIQNLNEFQEMRDAISRDLADSIHDEEELRRLNETLLDLGVFIRSRFIRSGEDVINKIITALDKKDADLTESEILSIDQRAAQVSDHDMWVKQSLRGLEKAFNRRGLSFAYEKENSFSDVESLVGRDSDRSDKAADASDEYSDSAPAEDLEARVTRDEARSGTENPGARKKRPRSSQRTRTQASLDDFAVPRSLLSHQTHTQTSLDDFAGPRPRRSNLTHQANLDDFAVPLDRSRRWKQSEGGSSTTFKNFRVNRAHEQRLLTDPQWDWARKSRHPAGSIPRLERHGTSHFSTPTTTKQTASTRERRGSGSVMEAVMKLRDKRFRARGRDGQSLSSRLTRSPTFQDSSRPLNASSAPSTTQGPEVDRFIGGSSRSSLTSRVPATTSSKAPEVNCTGARSREQPNWFKIFSVLPDEVALPPTPAKLMNGFTSIGVLEPLETSACDDVEEPTPKEFIRSISALRQRLVRIRTIESEAISAIHEARIDPAAGDLLSGIPEWRTATALSEGYHRDLISLFSSVRHTVASAHPDDVLSLVEAVVQQLDSSIRQIPDCKAIFGVSAIYPYFFEVAAGDSHSTPLVTAICRTYWYSLQVVVFLKQVCETRLSDSKARWSALFSRTFPPSRIALASCLFLVDLALHVPSTHRYQRRAPQTEECETPEPSCPALSLWMLLHQLLADGALNSTDGENNSIWNFLQSAYHKCFLDDIAIAFMKGSSTGGYVRERIPISPQDMKASMEELQGKILAADTLWYLCGLLSIVLKSAEGSVLLSIRSIPPWCLVKELLQGADPDCYPLSQLDNNEKDDENFKVQAYGFKVRVLKRLLVISALWIPEIDVMEKAMVHLWQTSYDEEGGDALASVVGFVAELRHVAETSPDSTFDLASDHAQQTTSLLALFCKIAVVQMSRLDKVVHRNRYRQPILRVLSRRQELHKSMRVKLLATEKSSPQAAATNGSTKSWDWGKREIKVASQATASALSSQVQRPDQPISNPDQLVSEVKHILSILLVFGLSSVYLYHTATGDVVSQSRRQKELSREIEFFCKEFFAVCESVPESTEQLCECLHALGTAAIDLRASYTSVFERVAAVLKVATTAHQQIHQLGVAAQKQTRQMQAISFGITESLRVLHDLSAQLINLWRAQQLEAAETSNLQSCARSALSDGIGQVFDAAVDGSLGLSHLDNAINLLVLWLPQEKHSPTRCLTVAPLAPAVSSEFDEFEDEEMMDLLANVDLDQPGVPSGQDHQTLVREIEEFVKQVALANLRIPIQRLVTSMPSKFWRRYQELYLLDVLGAMIATSSFSFSWSIVSHPASRNRLLAPRMMSTILQSVSQKDWFATTFLSEPNADIELSVIWLLATLDVKSLFPIECKFQPTPGECATARYSDYWLSLTDGILTNTLKENQVVRYKMDPLVHRLIYDTASGCSYRTVIQHTPGPTDTTLLYSMHADVFRTFCRAAGTIWRELSQDQTRRTETNRFRSRVMDKRRGAFVALPEAYEINLRLVCEDLDHDKTIRWFTLSSRFVEVFSPAITDTASLHTVDDATGIREMGDPAVRPLVVFYRFMYECVDAFLFNCGGMAIGQDNIFSSIMELMFRQARCAEFPTAKKRLSASSDSTSNHSFEKAARVTPSGNPTATGISQACAMFAESVRLFFAYQKYPSLVNWFVQNLETYQTVKSGWKSSPLRILLYNIFDPDGPLGVQSYYPIEDKGDRYDPGSIRRESFYVACGLFKCQCTTAYEHTRQSMDEQQERRRADLRRFLLNSYMAELFDSVLPREDVDETMLPAMQFIKATLNHANSGNAAQIQACVWDDFGASLCAAGTHMLHKLEVDRVLANTTTCVLMIEFCRISEEVLRLEHTIADGRLREFASTGIAIAAIAYRALGQYSSVPLEPIFANRHVSIQSLLQTLEILQRKGQKVYKKQAHSPTSPAASDVYGISRIRLRSDLLATIRRLVRCSRTIGGYDKHLQTTLSPTPAS